MKKGTKDERVLCQVSVHLVRVPEVLGLDEVGLGPGGVDALAGGGGGELADEL